MKLSFDTQLADNYTSQSQKVRVLTEAWVDSAIFCPNCGHLDIDKYPNNQPVADFYCSNCKEEYELKSKQAGVGAKIVDGAYRTMIERLQSSNNPNFFLLNYDLQSFEVLNFLVIPKHFFVPEIIEKRKPLSPTARRAGWVGCNILLKHIPQTGKIFLSVMEKSSQKKKFCRIGKKHFSCGTKRNQRKKVGCWTQMLCVEKIGQKEFSLDEMYAFENDLNKKHPDNRHIKGQNSTTASSITRQGLS